MAGKNRTTKAKSKTEQAVSLSPMTNNFSRQLEDLQQKSHVLTMSLWGLDSMADDSIIAKTDITPILMFCMELDTKIRDPAKDAQHACAGGG